MILSALLLLETLNCRWNNTLSEKEHAAAGVLRDAFKTHTAPSPTSLFNAETKDVHTGGGWRGDEATKEEVNTNDSEKDTGIVSTKSHNGALKQCKEVKDAPVAKVQPTYRPWKAWLWDFVSDSLIQLLPVCLSLVLYLHALTEGAEFIYDDSALPYSILNTNLNPKSVILDDSV